MPSGFTKPTVQLQKIGIRCQLELLGTNLTWHYSQDTHTFPKRCPTSTNSRDCARSCKIASSQGGLFLFGRKYAPVRRILLTTAKRVSVRIGSLCQWICLPPPTFNLNNIKTILHLLYVFMATYYHVALILN